MTGGGSGKQQEKLVVEVIGAHNLMPKDGEGSSSPFAEVEFNNQILRTQVKYKDLNPIWNEKLVFHVPELADLPYRTIEVNVFNERGSTNTRNFLGKVRISGSSVVREGEESLQLYTLDKRSLFSHIRGEISLKLYLSTKDHDNNNKQIVNNGGGSVSASAKKKKMQNQNAKFNVNKQQQQQQMGNDLNSKHIDQNTTGGAEMLKQPVVVTSGHVPNIPPNRGGFPAVGPGRMNIFANGSGDFSLKETYPHLGGGGDLGRDKKSSTYDLVEQMQYLYVRVVKAREFNVFGGELIAEVKLGNYRGVTNRVSANNAEWDQVFAFSKDCIQSSMVEVFVKEREKDDYLGRICFDLNEVPPRVPPDSQLAPQWYRLEDKKGDKSKAGEVMVSIWVGTQADEAFAEAWHSKAANVHFDGLCSIKSKVYLSPKLWYLRVSLLKRRM